MRPDQPRSVESQHFQESCRMAATRGVLEFFRHQTDEVLQVDLPMESAAMSPDAAEQADLKETERGLPE